MNKKLVIATTSAVSLLASVAAPAFGAVSCVTQYGGQYGSGQVCVKTGELQINKEVLNPKTSQFVDNIPVEGKDAYNFAPNQEVTFRLTIKNNGDEKLDNVQVVDTLPSFLQQVSGQEYSFTIATLAVGQSVQKEIKAQVVEIAKLPQDKTVTCDTNRASAQSGNEFDQDMAQLCVEKKIAKELPRAGAEDALAIIVSSGIFGFVGNKLIRAKKLIK